jgi:peptidoglycan hydrolase-like protein with peptidoglycan-binding domain
MQREPVKKPVKTYAWAFWSAIGIAALVAGVGRGPHPNDPVSSTPPPPTTTTQALADQGMAKINSVVDSDWSTMETQLCLRAVGFNVVADGVSGPQTQAATTAFRARMKEDGGDSDDDLIRCVNAILTYRASTPTQAAQRQAAAYVAPSPAYAAPSPVYVDPSHWDRTEHVSGYTRKNGTYVAPYVRKPSH